MDGTKIDAPQFGVRCLPPLRVTMASPAGGGFGHPRLRPPGGQFDTFRDALDVSLNAAIDLWASEHGNAPQTMQDRLLSASMRIDASIADAIMRPLGSTVFDLDGPRAQAKRGSAKR